MTNPKDETQRTHWEGCWKTYGHHDCAVERVAELEAELEAEIEARGPVAVTRSVDLTVEALQAQLAELQGKLAYAEAPHEWAANRIQELEAQLAERDARIAQQDARLDHLEAIGVDAYDQACEMMEKWQRDRKKRGLFPGTEGSLVDGIGWVYKYLSKVEAQLAERDARIAELVSALGRTASSFKRLLGRQPVICAEEVLAEAANVLASEEQRNKETK